MSDSETEAYAKYIRKLLKQFKKESFKDLRSVALQAGTRVDFLSDMESPAFDRGFALGILCFLHNGGIISVDPETGEIKTLSE